MIMNLSCTTHEIPTGKNHTLGVERGPLYDSSGVKQLCWAPEHIKTVSGKPGTRMYWTHKKEV